MAAPHPAPAPAGARILLAEDSGLAAAVATATLTREGHRVHVVANGHEALAALERLTFDLLITDWVMPGMDGVELCRQIRGREALRGLYILFLTARDGKRDVVGGLGAGADDYLPKPFDADELLARVRAGLRIVGLQRELLAANRTLRQLALTDELTDLPNRRALFEML